MRMKHILLSLTAMLLIVSVSLANSSPPIGKESTTIITKYVSVDQPAIAAEAQFVADFTESTLVAENIAADRSVAIESPPVVKGIAPAIITYRSSYTQSILYKETIQSRTPPIIRLE